MNARIPIPVALQNAAFTRRQGLDSGLGAGRLRGRDLQRPYRGVLVASTSELTLAHLCAARQRTLADHAHFCGITAAALTGVPLPRELERSRLLHVATTPEHRAPAGRGIRGYALRGAQWRDWHGLRVSTPERIWCELAVHLSVRDLVAAGDYLIHEPLAHTSEARLRTAVTSYAGRRGGPALLTAIDLLDGRAESRRESHVRVILAQAGVSGFVPNVWITTAGGYRYRADLASADRKLIVEYQGWHHFTPEQIIADMTRISRLEADEWKVMLVGSADLADPTELAERVARTLARRPHFG
ncbi:MAG: hypothetical protein ABJB03_11700 [Rhodoglobus sp.]